MILNDNLKSLGFTDPKLYSAWWDYGKSRYGDNFQDTNMDQMRNFFQYWQKMGNPLSDCQNKFVNAW